MIRIAIVGTALVAIATSWGCRTYPNGDEHGPCYADGTCASGLSCDQGVCRAPPEVDCRKVAVELSVLELGNYADMEEREALVAELTSRCDLAEPDKQQASCLLNAVHRGQLAWCDKPLLELEVCDRIVAHRFKLAKDTEFDRSWGVNRWVDAVEQCKAMRLTAEQQKCILAAKEPGDLAECQL